MTFDLQLTSSLDIPLTVYPEDNLQIDPIEAQREIETDSLTEAQGRIRKDHENSRNRGEWSDSRVGKAFVLQTHRKFVDAVTAFMSQPKEFGRRQNRAAEMLVKTGLEPEMVSYLFVKAAYNLMVARPQSPLKRVTFCIKSVSSVHDEWRIRVFSDTPQRKALLTKLKKDMDSRTYPKAWRLRTIRTYFDAERVEWAGWSQKEKLLIGYALMTLFRDNTGLILVGKNDTYVQPAPELMAAVTQAIEKNVLSFTLYSPMVVPPRPWDVSKNLFRGGYLGKGQVRPYPIIKGARKRDADRLLQMDWGRILPAVNALQETPWRVNKTMIEALDWVYADLADGRCDLPLPEAAPIPPAPAGYDDVDHPEHEAIKKHHNRVCFEIHDSNRQMISKRIAVLYTIHLAKKFTAFQRVYFPHNLDVRGRAYPLPAFLNPQGPDYAKGLLEFSEAEPIEDDEQAAWLAVAGANAYGNDKVSLQERADWVVDNEDWIIACGTDFREHREWMDASEPFQFLRFCIEWAGYVAACEAGETFYSRMPCPVDATNSGLQHYSAMLRDEVGGRSVNLIPGLDRQDIYGDVARVAEFKLALLQPTEDNPEAARWAADWIAMGIDRKMTKRQVMVVPYAGKFTSCMEYTRKGYHEKVKGGFVPTWDRKEDFDRCTLLAKVIWEAIDEVVVKGKEAMKWLSKIALDWAKYANEAEVDSPYERRMTWHTPDGFEVVQWRDQSKKGQVSSFIEGGRVQLVHYEEGDLLDTREMALSTPPNFVHSLDATHMRMAVIRALDMDIRHFAMVHDSFGVHARFMPSFLADAVKPSFIEMYAEHDPLQDLRARCKFPTSPPPSLGGLNLEGIRESEFFFS